MRRLKQLIDFCSQSVMTSPLRWALWVVSIGSSLVQATTFSSAGVIERLTHPDGAFLGLLESVEPEELKFKDGRTRSYEQYRFKILTPLFGETHFDLGKEDPHPPQILSIYSQKSSFASDKRSQVPSDQVVAVYFRVNQNPIVGTQSIQPKWLMLYRTPQEGILPVFTESEFGEVTAFDLQEGAARRAQSLEDSENRLFFKLEAEPLQSSESDRKLLRVLKASGSGGSYRIPIQTLKAYYESKVSQELNSDSQVNSQEVKKPLHEHPRTHGAPSSFVPNSPAEASSQGPSPGQVIDSRLSDNTSLGLLLTVLFLLLAGWILFRHRKRK